LSPGPYGTFDQGGDLFQWNETAMTGSWRGVRVGSFDINSNNLRSSVRNNDDPTDENNNIGFRVASSWQGDRAWRDNLKRPDFAGWLSSANRARLRNYPVVRRAGREVGRRRMRRGCGE
jgi:hypothetical protein